MIYPETVLNIIDNSGAGRVRCIKTLKSSKRKGAKLGSIIIVSVIAIRKGRSKKIKRGMIFKALVVQTKKYYKSNAGLHVCFGNNSAILLNNKSLPVGNRVLFPVSRELKNKK
ncbi:UNVERIFIED_CONTAM: hypothetical protein GTU68_065750 [Idotea baltica]|nr:hypothetical protein [Idotea baltica]